MRLEGLSDHQLLTLFASGNTLAFEKLYDRYWKGLYVVAYRILEDVEQSKDVVQEVFCSFFERAGTKTIDNLRAYLFQCTKYQCFMLLRAGSISRKHLQRLSLLTQSNAVDEEHDAAELQEILQKGMAALPERCREVFYLSRMESMSNKKIAQQLNISTKTVENQITKALKSLKITVDKLGLVILAYFF